MLIDDPEETLLTVAEQNLMRDIAAGWKPQRFGERWILLPLIGKKPPATSSPFEHCIVEDLLNHGMVEMIGPNDNSLRLTFRGSEFVRTNMRPLASED